MNVHLATALGAGLLGLAAAHPLWRWLCTHGYRYDDEQDVPTRRHTWVLVGLPLAAALTVMSLQSRWPVVIAVLYGLVLVPLAALTAIDLDVHRLPDRITFPLAGASVVIAAACSLTTGDWGSFGRALLAGLAMLAGFFVLFVIAPRGGFGFGDVKLAPSLGILLGWFGWPAVQLGLMALLLVTLVGTLGMLALRRVRLRGEMAYGPFMIIGYAVAAALQ